MPRPWYRDTSSIIAPPARRKHQASTRHVSVCWSVLSPHAGPGALPHPHTPPPSHPATPRPFFIRGAHVVCAAALGAMLGVAQVTVSQSPNPFSGAHAVCICQPWRQCCLRCTVALPLPFSRTRLVVVCQVGQWGADVNDRCKHTACMCGSFIDLAIIHIVAPFVASLTLTITTAEACGVLQGSGWPLRWCRAGLAT